MGEMEDVENITDDEVNEASHKNLLSAVSRIYKKQRVEKPQRSEPNLNVSEYHLSNYEGQKDKPNNVLVNDLVDVLDSQPSHLKIHNKFAVLKSYSSKLPKPLEKIHVDRIKRSIGYEHLKKDVSRWSGVVLNNRIAPHLSFPLKEKEEIKVYEPLTFLRTFSQPTELEKEMAAVLRKSGVAEEESKTEESLFSLSVNEMIEKRKLMAGIKAKESFKIVKAMKQNKIKSKKYRRIVRKEKLKQALKDFETLQKTDPEAALEKLNKLEKERAEERATLRHRNTGKWARNQAIRAKYDVEARKQLADQISKSRELTHKSKVDSSSDDEDNSDVEETNESGQKNVGDTSDNPWTKEDEKPDQSVDDFIAGYQDYWKNKKNTPKPKQSFNKKTLARLLGKDKSTISFQTSSSISNNSNTGIAENQSSTFNIFNSNAILTADCDLVNSGGINSHESDKGDDSPDKIIRSKTSPLRDSNLEMKMDLLNASENKTLKNNKKSCVIKSVCEKNMDLLSNSNLNAENSFKADSFKFSSFKSGNEKNKNISVLSRSNSIDIDRKKRKQEQTIKKKQRISTSSGSWEVSTGETCSDQVYSVNNEGNVTSRKGIVKHKNKKKTLSRKKERSKLVENGSDNFKCSIVNNASIGDIFDNMEDNLFQKVQERLKNFECISSSDEEDEKKTKKVKRRKTNVDSAASKEKSQPHKMLNEEISAEVEDRDNEMDELLDIINNDKSEPNEKGSDKASKEPEIDLNKFLNVKPRLLQTQVPDMLTEGDDMLDDPESDQRMKISEAFADDDVVEEFRKEKEDEVKKSGPEDVNLFLPGWGSWGGPNIDEKRMMRKRKRFFLKAPQLPRADKKKPNVIISGDISDKYKEHFVSDVPYPFTSVRDYEASIRAPLGSTWIPEQAVSKLNKPPVFKKMGTIIEPMNEDHLPEDKEKKLKLNVVNVKKDDNQKIM